MVVIWGCYAGIPATTGGLKSHTTSARNSSFSGKVSVDVA